MFYKKTNKKKKPNNNISDFNHFVPTANYFFQFITDACVMFDQNITIAQLQ